MKAKRYWLVLSIRILKNSPHKTITVKHLFPVVKSSRTLLGLLGTEDFLFIPCFLTPASRTFPEFQKGRFQQLPFQSGKGREAKIKAGQRKQQCSLRANTIWRFLPLRKWQPTLQGQRIPVSRIYGSIIRKRMNKGSFNSPSLLLWLLLNSRIVSPFWEKEILAWYFSNKLEDHKWVGAEELMSIINGAEDLKITEWVSPRGSKQKGTGTETVPSWGSLEIPTIELS